MMKKFIYELLKTIMIHKVKLDFVSGKINTLEERRERINRIEEVWS